MIQSINIHKDNINGIISLLIKLEIPTLYDEIDNDDEYNDGVGEWDDNIILLQCQT